MLNGNDNTIGANVGGTVGGVVMSPTCGTNNQIVTQRIQPQLTLQLNVKWLNLFFGIRHRRRGMMMMMVVKNATTKNESNENHDNNENHNENHNHWMVHHPSPIFHCDSSCTMVKCVQCKRIEESIPKGWTTNNRANFD